MDQHPVNLFAGTIDTLSRSLDLRARNHEMILNNVANADTPNFKPFSVNVEQAIQKERRGLPDASMQRTDPRHLPGQPVAEETTDRVRKEESDPLLFRGDGNGVDIDAEMAALAKNSLLYRASSQIIGSKFKGLKNAINGGNK